MFDPLEEDPPPTPNRRKLGGCGDSFLGDEEENRWNSEKSTSASSSICADTEQAGIFSERASVEAVMGLMITDLESSASRVTPTRNPHKTTDFSPFHVPSFATSAMMRPSHRHGSLSLACAR